MNWPCEGTLIDICREAFLANQNTESSIVRVCLKRHSTSGDKQSSLAQLYRRIVMILKLVILRKRHKSSFIRYTWVKRCSF